MRSSGQDIDVTNPGKEIFHRITKQQIIDYYKSVASIMLSHIKQRPLSLERFPDGVEGEIFYQKRLPGYFPEWIGTAEVKKGQEKQTQVAINSRAGILYLANQLSSTRSSNP